jgi:segregation and condensation protein A
MANPQTLSVTLPDWEGPLDLLLHVIRAHKLDILDIPIAFVTEQYLAYLDAMRDLNLDIAAEYLEMAATLLHIKSRMLLPDPPEVGDELPAEEPDPREDLIRRLLEYQRYKDAAAALAGRPMLGRDTFAPAGEPDPSAGDEPLVELGVFDLLEAFRSILERTKVPLAHDVTTERLSVSERIGELADLLRPGEMVPFDRLFEGRASPLEIVVTFLALLEMTKLRMTRLFQAGKGGQIYVSIASGAHGTRIDGLSAPAPRGREGGTWQRRTGRRPRRERRVPRTLQLLRISRTTRQKPRTVKRSAPRMLRTARRSSRRSACR